MAMKHFPKLIDATLREGFQAPDVHFSTQQVCEIAQRLVNAGADMLEVGHPLISEEAMAHVSAVVGMDLGVPILSHARAHPDDINAVARSGAAWVGIFLGVNPMTERTRLTGSNFPALLDKIAASVHEARQHGLRVRYTIEDASRTPLDRLLTSYRTAVEAGAQRLCFADSVGLLEPKQTGLFMSTLRREFPDIELEAHFHDDRGLAMANAIQAVESGVDWISVSTNGLGERCGITDHGVLAVNLHHRGERTLEQGQGEQLHALSNYVAHCSGQPISPASPIFGDHAFTHTARLHVKAVKRDPNSYQWIDPVQFGQACKISKQNVRSNIVTETVVNEKTAGWDIVGGLFWEKGRKSAKPSESELELFTAGIKAGDKVAVIGASTKDLVEHLMAKNVDVTVYDFSKGMCESLQEALAPNAPPIHVLDITAPLNSDLIGYHDYVLNDRLVNRFTTQEAEKALMNMVALAKQGEVRASVKLGLYAMDEKMIELGKGRQVLDRFYCEKTQTIDFSKAGDILEESLVPHGNIDREVLLQWYRSRGMETRFSDESLKQLIQSLTFDDGSQVAVKNQCHFPDAQETIMYSLKSV
ncbi:hypothetical protein F0237_09990 [Vibrio tubiashii]|uniref:2-isopropylmalate synthase n=2 Tax=Vibrio tubiashii TaxID=29498 RepID=A0AAE5GQ89_9VIBR|nr:hypothetical protein [Vibrio tubiashii]